MRINIARENILNKILERKKKTGHGPRDIDLKVMLKEILWWANKFVPSESGSILLDDPSLNSLGQKSGVLYFVACFGKGSKALVEASMPSDVGIAGSTYLAGRPYISKTARQDKKFYAAIDKKTKFRTKSIICAPVKIKGATIGVIELLNRLNGVNYSQNDLSLLKIFAGYTSTLIQNSLDAKKFGELSIKDNLTGLYNDRYFYDRLVKDIRRALNNGSDLSLLFLDLDRFKEVNDNHGHLAGSRVLIEVGTVLANSLYKAGSTAARYGGDEFIVILPDTGIQEASNYAEKLRKTIEECIFLKHKYNNGTGKAVKLQGQITSSIGIASLRSNISPSLKTINEIRELLIKLADSAMYSSKENGRNKTTIAPFSKPLSKLGKAADMEAQGI